jgi:hypothetical protein
MIDRERVGGVHCVFQIGGSVNLKFHDISGMPVYVGYFSIPDLLYLKILVGLGHVLLIGTRNETVEDESRLDFT